MENKNTKIILIRHGQSLGNAANIYLGHTNWDLSEVGYEQANTAAESIKDMEISAVYSSSLIRAHNTALPHAKLRGLEVIDDDELKEIYIGDWEGMPVPELKKKEEFIHGWTENFGTFCPPNGESVPHAAERMYNAVLKIAKRHPGGTVLIAAHAAVIRSFYGKVSKIPAEKLASELPFPTNTSLSTVIFDGENLLPVSYSDDSHLSK